MSQTIITAENNYIGLDQWIEGKNCKTVLLVCDSSIKFLKQFNGKIDELKNKEITFVIFSDFQPNPLYDSTVAGVKKFRDKKCDSIMAVGGGSAIDVAKCIKLYCNMAGNGENGDYLKQEIVPNSIPFIAMPTTAGTGSEATRYAVIYYEGNKQSVTSENCIPDAVLFDPSVLETLPLYQKKATMMDAFCHAIESFWSVNSTDESKQYSKKAIELILSNVDNYLKNKESSNEIMLKAANIAGKAINITQTTAGHAMCYKLTSLYGIAHGHAAALCVKTLFPYMADNIDKCSDSRGVQYLKKTFDEIATAMGCDTVLQATERFSLLVNSLELKVPIANMGDIDVLKKSVNPVRLKNNPVILDEQTIESLYKNILGE